jgi:hypothetical protein
MVNGTQNTKKKNDIERNCEEIVCGSSVIIELNRFESNCLFIAFSGVRLIFERCEGSGQQLGSGFSLSKSVFFKDQDCQHFCRLQLFFFIIRKAINCHPNTWTTLESVDHHLYSIDDLMVVIFFNLLHKQYKRLLLLDKDWKINRTHDSRTNTRIKFFIYCSYY